MLKLDTGYSVENLHAKMHTLSLIRMWKYVWSFKICCISCYSCISCYCYCYFLALLRTSVSHPVLCYALAVPPVPSTRYSGFSLATL
jgi:hypothetical protein